MNRFKLDQVPSDGVHTIVLSPDYLTSLPHEGVIDLIDLPKGYYARTLEMLPDLKGNLVVKLEIYK